MNKFFTLIVAMFLSTVAVASDCNPYTVMKVVSWVDKTGFEHVKVVYDEECSSQIKYDPNFKSSPDRIVINPPGSPEGTLQVLDGGTGQIKHEMVLE